jgi:cytoskeleton protein RodZ
VRESQGVSLKEVSRHTKIGLNYLKAIEADDHKVLPALVYVRGFVAEFAKYLSLDAKHVTRTYVRQYRRTED